MPHLKKLRNVVIQILILLSLIAITGHLIANYRERHAMQDDIYHIRTSLHNLKHTINTIGITYDKLYKDLTSFVADKLPTDGQNLKFSNKKTTESAIKNLLLIENLNNSEKDKIKQFILQVSNNATTTTRYPLKTIGVGSETMSQCPIKECKKDMQLKSNIHKCYKNLKTCSCNFNDW